MVLCTMLTAGSFWSCVRGDLDSAVVCSGWASLLLIAIIVAGGP